MTLLNETFNGKESKNSSLVRNGNLSSLTEKRVTLSAQHEAIQDWLINRLAKSLEIEPQEIDIQKDFSEYGLDSVEAINLSGELESFLGCRLSPTLLWDYQNIDALAQYLAETTPSINKIDSSPRLEILPPIPRKKRSSSSVQIQGEGESFASPRNPPKNIIVLIAP